MILDRIITKSYNAQHIETVGVPTHSHSEWRKAPELLDED